MVLVEFSPRRTVDTPGTECSVMFFRVHDSPGPFGSTGDSVADNVMFPENPFRLVIVRLVVCDDPRVRTMLVWLVEILKSGSGMVIN